MKEKRGKERGKKGWEAARVEERRKEGEKYGVARVFLKITQLGART